MDSGLVIDSKCGRIYDSPERLASESLWKLRERELGLFLELKKDSAGIILGKYVSERKEQP
jgi:hypothetical protein